MIDFQNASFLKMKNIDVQTIYSKVAPILISGEELISAYKTVRDFVLFTNKRVIAVNVQGVTGKKKDFTSLPYSKVSAFSIESADVFDLDSELEMYFSGLGKVTFEFLGSKGILEVGRVLSEYIL